ncbi:phytanoyl-CoA dioxygenase family protein [Paenibacillus nasutitermitis]|uniref:SnoK n=1 Tax=Paenibacillus nasutitermitis TaxID=1652958 RepID=A0A916ZB69_9BACL|nr:phytanoyl-CoA dioxygenase family protein [Paenibacillus nasutitermitis]GGD85472.1 SnoK [Paenibacillus nasutitermitis]
MPNANGIPTQDDVKFFKENGYWVSPKIIDDERLSRLRERMERVYRNEFETGTPPEAIWSYEKGHPKTLRKTDMASYADLTIRALTHDPVIGEIAAALTEADTIRFWADQLLHKPEQSGGHASNVGWHQDYTYWKCFQNPETLLTAWVAYDDVDEENGCMMMVPGSNQWGLLNGSDFYEQNLDNQKNGMNVPEGRVFRTMPIVMKAGQVSFHHSLTIHGSGPNISDRVRRSSALHLMTGETRFRYDERHQYLSTKQFMASGGKDGDIVQGDMYPVIYKKGVTA